MDAEHCRYLLASVRVARVAFVDGGRPRIVVMNHRADGDDVLLRTDVDARLAALTEGGASVPVELEVDSVSSAGRSGWSVIASGSLVRDEDAPESHLPLPWRSGATDVVLRLHVEHIRGLQVAKSDDLRDDAGDPVVRK
jgi:nitroimidazol reductase NimA-like FMN-containing flavoprotein (pyridoxamine 5'-phosphate oxidase superfamily)